MCHGRAVGRGLWGKCCGSLNCHDRQLSSTPTTLLHSGPHFPSLLRSAFALRFAYLSVARHCSTCGLTLLMFISCPTHTLLPVACLLLSLFWFCFCIMTFTVISLVICKANAANAKIINIKMKLWTPKVLKHAIAKLNPLSQLHLSALSFSPSLPLLSLYLLSASLSAPALIN